MKTISISTLVLLTLSAPQIAFGQTDDFNDGNDSGWTRYNPVGLGSWSFPTGGYRIQSGSTGIAQNPGRAGSVRGDVTYTNFYISVDITNWNDNVNQAAGILARVTDAGLGTTDGYAFTWDRGTTATSGDVDISRIDNEAPTGVAVAGSDALHLVPGRTYRFVFIGIENRLEGRVYEHPNLTNPVVQVVGLDATHASGLGGLVVYAQNTTATPDITFDNYFATESEPISPPPIFIDRFSPDGVTVSWSTNLAGFVLQAAPSLSAASPAWRDITEAIFVNDLTGRYEYFEFTSTGDLFFRLRRPED